MSERSLPPAPPRCACIDPSPLYLWPLHDVLELMPLDSADNPQARRLAVLCAEAHAAGQATAVLATLCEWTRVLLSVLPDAYQLNGVSRIALVGVLGAAETIAMGPDGELPQELGVLLEEIAGGSPDSTAENAAVLLAGYALAQAAVPHVAMPPEDAWQAAAAILCAIAEVAGETIDPTIARCAEIAYRRLFAATSTRAA
jgi:hypothetical protein